MRPLVSRARRSDADALRAELVERPALRGRVELAGRVLAERGQLADLERLAPRARAELSAARAQGPDRAAAVVAVDVAPPQAGDRLAAIDVAARDRAARGVAVDRDRPDERAARVHLLSLRVARAALPHAPAVVVQPAPLPRRADVDLLPLVLADVADVEVARSTIEREAPGVAQAVSGDLPGRTALVHVQAQQLSEPGAEALRVVVRVAAGASVARARIEPAVRAELQLPAVVVGKLAVAHPQQRLARVGQADAAVRAELVHAHVAAEVVEVDEEAVVLRVVGVERHREQPLLAAEGDAVADVEERLGLQLAVDEHADHAGLLDDVELRRLAARLRDVHGVVEPARDRAQAHLLHGRRGALAARGTRQRHRDQDEQDPREAHHVLSRTLRNSSSLPGCRIASTWSPGCSSVEPTAISERPLRMIEIRREPSGRLSFSTRLPAAGAPGGICTSTMSRFSLRSSSRWTRSCSGTSCSISAIRPRVAETVGEIPSRSKCVWLRGSFTRAITFRTPYFSFESWQMIRLSSSSPVSAATTSGGRAIPARSSTQSAVGSPGGTWCSNSGWSRSNRSRRCSIRV